VSCNISVSTVWVKNIATYPRNFLQYFTQANYISVKFCQYVASLHPHIFTNFGRFILIFNKMTLIFLGVLTVFNISSFIKSNCRDFTANDEWSPIHPTSIHCIIRFGKKAGVLLHAATKAKNSSQVYRCTSADLVCLARESHWQHCEKQPQVTADMCVSQRQTFWTYSVTIYITDANCYI